MHAHKYIYIYLFIIHIINHLWWLNWCSKFHDHSISYNVVHAKANHPQLFFFFKGMARFGILKWPWNSCHGVGPINCILGLRVCIIFPYLTQQSQVVAYSAVCRLVKTAVFCCQTVLDVTWGMGWGGVGWGGMLTFTCTCFMKLILRGAWGGVGCDSQTQYADCKDIWDPNLGNLSRKAGTQCLDSKQRQQGQSSMNPRLTTRCYQWVWRRRLHNAKPNDLLKALSKHIKKSKWREK